MSAHAYDRIDAGQPMSGLFLVHRDLPMALVIDDMHLIAVCSEAAEWDGQVRFLPLR